MAHQIQTTRVFQGDNGKYGLEAVGRDTQIVSKFDPEHVFEPEADVKSTTFSDWLLGPRYDSIEELERVPRIDNRSPGSVHETYYRLASDGKVGLYFTRFERNFDSDHLKRQTVVDCAVYDQLVKVGALIFVRESPTPRSSKYGVLECFKRYTNTLPETRLICVSRSWDKLVRRLRKKMPNVTDDDLRQAYEGLLEPGPVRTAAGEALGKISDPRADKGETTSQEKVLRRPKPLKINLGDAEESTLQSIVESGSPVTIAQDIKSDLVTPDLARRAIQAKQHEQRADGLAQSRKFKEAAEEYKRAIDIAPYEDEILYMSWGGVLSEIGEYTDALEYLETASAINPLNEDVARNVRIARINAGKN